MASYSNDLRVKQIATGDEDGTWGASTNDNLGLIADAFGYGTKQLAGDADETFTMPDGAADDIRALYLKITSAVTLTAARTVTIAPNTVNKLWIIENDTTGTQSIIIQQGSGTTVTIPQGVAAMVATDGVGSGASVIYIDAKRAIDFSRPIIGVLPIEKGGTNAASASSARTNLGLAIGTDVQAYNAALQSISGLTTAANKMIYATASNVYAVTDLSAFGRTLIDDADAATARGTLGLGTAAVKNTGTSGDAVPVLNAANTFSAAQTTTGTRAAINAVAASEISWGAGDYHTKSISANTTFTFSNIPSGAAAGIVVRVTSTGDFTINWPAAVIWPDGVAPALVASKTHLFTFITDNNGVTIRGAYSLNYAS